MAIHLTTGSPASGMSFTESCTCPRGCCHTTPDRFTPYCRLETGSNQPWSDVCTPPAENFNPSGASEGADGQGVCSSIQSGPLPSYQGLVSSAGLSTFTNLQPNSEAIQKKTTLPNTANAKSSQKLNITASSKLSNLDCTRRAAVRKGSVVEFPGGATVRVSRVRLGWFWTCAAAQRDYFACGEVKVIG